MGRSTAALTALLSTATASRVAVTITQKLAVPPGEARAAWLDYAWSRGGGLLGVAAKVADDLQSRTLYPVLLRERLLPTSTDVEVPKVAYTLTDAGPLLNPDVVEGSHSGVVSFVPSEQGTELEWSVEFEARERAALWEAVTRTNVGEVAANLAAYTAPETVFRLRASLGAPPAVALATWLQCLRDADLGIPLPMLPPVVVAEGDASGAGYERLILPPGLRERVTRVDASGDTTSVEYMVTNPGWLRLWPTHSHRGVVEFAPADGGGSELTWRMAVRPYRGAAAMPMIRALTELIIPAFTRNLAERLGETDAADVQSSWSYE